MNNGQNHTDDLLSAYHDGELSAIEREAAEKLLAESAEVRAELEDYQRLSAELRALPEDAPVIDVSASVLAAIGEPAREQATAQPASKKSRRRWRFVLPIGLVGAVAASVLALVAWQFGDDWGSLGMTVADRGAETASSGVNASPDMGNESMAADAGAPAGRFGPMTAAESGEAASGATSASPAPRILAGSNARPPAGINVGDIYSYIDRTDDGEIVVVQAYVVDVRRAVDQMQVLLARNSIPTAKVSHRANATMNLGLPATAPRSDLALYVESDPQRIKMAFQDLERQFELKSNAIQGIRVSGILETNHAAASMRGMGVAGTNANGFSFLPPQEAPKPDRLSFNQPAVVGKSEASLAEEEPLGRGLGKHMNGTPKALEPLRNRFTAPDQGDATGSATESAAAERKQADAVPQFQTMVNVSNGIILEQLQLQRKITGGKTDGSGSSYSLKSGAWERGRLKGNEADSNRTTKPKGSANRTRLLLVIQKGPAPPVAPAEKSTGEPIGNSQ